MFAKQKLHFFRFNFAAYLENGLSDYWRKCFV